MYQKTSHSGQATCKTYFCLSPRFQSFGSGQISLNPALRPNLRLNSDDSLCPVIDSCEIN